MLSVCCIQLTVQQVSKNDRYHNVVYSKWSETVKPAPCFILSFRY